MEEKSGQNLKVEIKVTMLEQENRKYMSIIVQDNGEDIIKKLSGRSTGRIRIPGMAM